MNHNKTVQAMLYLLRCALHSTPPQPLDKIDYEELYKLIADKNLPPKAKENSCIYGYFLAVMGEDNKYFKVDSFGKGTFNNFTVNKRDLFLGDKKIF